jgi:hypothetical protein
MQSRSVGLGAMFGWIPATFHWFERGGATLMGASLIMVLSFLVLSLPMYAVMFAGGAFTGATASPLAGQSTLFWSLYAATILATLVLYPPMVVGWFRLARDVDTGANVAATQILHPYRDRALWGRSLAFALLVVLVYLVVIGLFAAAFYRPVADFIAHIQLQQAAMAAGRQPPPPDFPFVLVPAYFLFIGAMMLMHFVYMVGFAEIALRPTPVLAALRLALAGVLRNLFKLALLVFVLGLGMLLVWLVLALVIMLLVVALSWISHTLGIVAMFAVYLALVVVVYPLMFGGQYFMWKDMIDEAAPAEGVEA